MGNCCDLSLGSSIICPGRTIIVSNPPWGLRLSEDVIDSWDNMRQFFANECGGTEGALLRVNTFIHNKFHYLQYARFSAWILSGNKNLTRTLRMKKSRSFPISTGNESLRWIQYHIFPKQKH